MVSWCSLLLVNLFVLGLGLLEPVGFCIKPGSKFLLQSLDENPLATPYRSGILSILLLLRWTPTTLPLRSTECKHTKSHWQHLLACNDNSSQFNSYPFLVDFVQFKTVGWSHEVSTLRVTLHPFRLQLWHQLHLQRYCTYAFLHPLSTINRR